MIKKNDVQLNNLSELVDFTLKDTENKRGFVDLGELPNEQIENLKEQTGKDLSGFKRMVDSYSIKHIFKNHGNSKTEATRGQIAVTKNDIENLPTLLAETDKSKLDGLNRLGREVIKHEKKETHKHIIIEEIRPKNKVISLDSMWILKK